MATTAARGSSGVIVDLSILGLELRLLLTAVAELSLPATPIHPAVAAGAHVFSKPTCRALNIHRAVKVRRHAGFDVLAHPRRREPEMTGKGRLGHHGHGG